jgi:hypothetical protein
MRHTFEISLQIGEGTCQVAMTRRDSSNFFNRKRTSGGQREKELLAKKLQTQKGPLFCVFKTGLGGVGQVYMPIFPIADHFTFVFPRGAGASAGESK